VVTVATPVKILGNTTKHWTNAEKQQRAAAEDGLRRENIKIRMPGYLKADKTAVYFWKKTIKEAADIELYDNTDADTLATYCQLMSRIIELREQAAKNKYDLDLAKELRQQEALQKQYASALGLTPESRARLARKRTAAIKDDADDLYGEA
jgi:P27 family predicted phage terminase small subunit